VDRASSPTITTYPLVGVVRSVDAGAKRVVIRHEEIPGFMPQMTMPFSVADANALAAVRPGDKVSATLKVRGDHSELADLTVTEPAEPQELTLDLSAGEAKVRPRIPKLEPGDEVPDFAMTTQDGSTQRLSDLRGEVVVVTFIYTRCPLPDFCPKMDERFAELARMVGAVPGRAEKVRLVSVSFDPEHDTPEVLARHAKLRGARPPLWRFAVASHEELSKVAEPLGLMYGPRKDEIIHNLTTSVIGPDGRLVRRLEGSSWSPEDVFKTIRGLLPK
jgi:protein SCO1/2